MTTRTAKGTNSTKASGTTIVLADVTISKGHSLIVGVAGQSGNFPTGVTWGNRKLSRVRRRAHGTANFTGSLWMARRVHHTDTRDITATWESSINAKAILALTLDGPCVRDVHTGAQQTASTAPSSGATGTTSVADTFAIGLLVSEGPSSDDAPSLQNGFTAGQRVGTTGAPPVSNITMLEGFKALVADISAQTLEGTGATERDWVGLIVSLRESIFKPWDYHGDEINVGDFVLHQDVEREVLAIEFQRDTVELEGYGWISGVDCEVIR